MVYYKLVKVTINAPRLAEVIIDMVVCHHGLLDSIVTDKGFLFTSKFWSSLCYLFGIKQRVSTAFHLYTDSHTKWQNKTMEAYFQAFINFKQNDWARFLLMAGFPYNNAKNGNTSHILLSWIVSAIFEFLMRKTLTSVPSSSQQKSYWQS